MKKAVVYARVSSDTQQKEATIESQLFELKLHREVVWVFVGLISINCLPLLLSPWACEQRAALSTRSGMSTALLRRSAGAFWTSLCLAHDCMADTTNKRPDA